VFAGAWFAVGLVAILGGPPLGDHEVIVAQIARQSLRSGSWLVLEYLDTPFLVKPPLTPWLIGAVSHLLPASGGHPVNEFTARLPSLAAALLTGWIILRLGSSMFGRRAGVVAAFAWATAVGPLLYAFNATSESLLTLLCTWSFAEFWWSRRTSGTRRTLHLVRFYIALGLAMMAKGPMPLAAVAVPIAAWWWGERALMVLACGGPRRIGRAAGVLVLRAGRRLKSALGGLGIWWGIPLFLLVFLPWMILVSRRVPYFWELWEYEYLDRAEGRYPGVRSSRLLYYLPILLGMLVPWSLSLPEALASPFLAVYRRHRRPLMYLWHWVVAVFAVMSLMGFKKSYYILPAVPGCALLLGPVLERMFFCSVSGVSRRTRLGVAGILAGVVLVATGAWFIGRRAYPERWIGWVPLLAPAFAALALVGFGVAGWLYLRRRGRVSLGCVGATGYAVFIAVWLVMGPSLGDLQGPMDLVRGLDRANVPPTADLYWASNRPDGRVLFYGNRPIRQVVDPYRLIAEHREGVSDMGELRTRVGEEVVRRLQEEEARYFVLQRGDFELLMALFRAPARILFHVDRGPPGVDEDDWVVVSNAGVEDGIQTQ
jgi:4-amino-4-deoxy-L-arabinose transferase-like glycosyltransferase